MSTPPSSPTNSISQPDSSSPLTSVNNINSDPPIVNFSLNQVINDVGIVIVNQEGQDVSGNEITHTVFDGSSNDIHINEDLTQIVKVYDDEDPLNPNYQVLNEIKLYASKIQCSDFHGKGSIDDYSELFQAASRIANESKQMTLAVNIDGFNEFAQAADDLSSLFNSFILKLQNVNIINDLSFLNSISIALHKIYNLSEVFGKFKETIIATSTIQVPKSIHDTQVAISSVMSEVNCAMKYISHFVDSSSPAPVEANLSVDEENIISKAVTTINDWNNLCEHGVSISLNNNVDIQSINNSNILIQTNTNKLKIATNNLRLKFASFNITH